MDGWRVIPPAGAPTAGAPATADAPPPITTSAPSTSQLATSASSSPSYYRVDFTRHGFCLLVADAWFERLWVHATTTRDAMDAIARRLLVELGDDWTRPGELRRKLERWFERGDASKEGPNVTVVESTGVQDNTPDSELTFHLHKTICLRTLDICFPLAQLPSNVEQRVRHATITRPLAVAHHQQRQLIVHLRKLVDQKQALVEKLCMEILGSNPVKEEARRTVFTEERFQDACRLCAEMTGKLSEAQIWSCAAQTEMASTNVSSSTPWLRVFGEDEDDVAMDANGASLGMTTQTSAGQTGTQQSTEGHSQSSNTQDSIAASSSQSAQDEAAPVRRRPTLTVGASSQSSTHSLPSSEAPSKPRKKPKLVVYGSQKR